MSERLDTLMEEARRRLLGQHLAEQLAHRLRLALALGVVLIAGDRLWRLSFEPWWLVGALLLVALAAAAGFAWRRRLTPHAAALVLDERLGLSERLSSALALRDSAPNGALLAPLWADAERCAGGLDLRRALPHRWPGEARVCGVLLLLLAVVGAMPRLAVWRTEADLATEMVSRQVGSELDQVAREVEAKAGPEQERARRQAQRLRREALRLRRARMGKQQALRRLEKLNRDLQQQRETLAGRRLRTTGREARRDLRRMGEVGEALGEQLEDPRAAAAGELLRELARKARDGKLTKEERQRAAEELEQAAKALSGSRYQSLAGQLADAAKALNGSGEQAAEALEKAAKGAGQGGEAEQELLEQLQEYVQGGKNALGDAEGLRDEALREHGGQCPDGLCQPGEGDGGEGQGSGRGGRAGRSRGPGTTNEEAESTPSEGAPQSPYQPGDSPDDPTKAEYERLYAPRRTETMQSDERVRGRAGRAGGFRTEQGPRDAPGLSDSRVPYYDVVGEYRAEADEALARGDIPVTERHRVKRYFDELQEGRR